MPEEPEARGDEERADDAQTEGEPEGGVPVATDGNIDGYLAQPVADVVGHLHRPHGEPHLPGVDSRRIRSFALWTPCPCTSISLGSSERHAAPPECRAPLRADRVPQEAR